MIYQIFFNIQSVVFYQDIFFFLFRKMFELYNSPCFFKHIFFSGAISQLRKVKIGGGEGSKKLILKPVAFQFPREFIRKLLLAKKDRRGKIYEHKHLHLKRNKTLGRLLKYKIMKKYANSI